MRTFKLTLAYDGTAYAGWQSQPGEPTLQGTLEKALEKITGQSVRTVASGRTDSGVHALGQVVGFHVDTPLAADVLQRALNAELPHDMAVVDAAEAPDGFHAIRDARRKRYRYVIHNARVHDVFLRRYAWHVYEPLDVAVMHTVAQGLLGTHDFSSFETQGSSRETSVRTVYELSVRRGEPEGDAEESRGADRIIIEVEADGFLYNMVRAIVGTLVEVGRGAKPATWPAEVLAAQSRRAAGPTAPPQGLFLLRVDYS